MGGGGGGGLIFLCILSVKCSVQEIEVVYSSPFLRCLQTADVACKALGIPGFHTHNNLCEFLHPGNRIHAAPAVPATDDITNINILTFDLSPLPDYPETVQSVNVRYQEAVSVIADANWPANVLIVSHEICVREACKWGGCNDEVEATYCGHVELKRTERGSRDWTLLGYKGVFKYDSIIE